MDNHHLRSIILKLDNRLSDNDRKRLHFFLANDVPRRIRDDPTLSGTLNLMESLFDQHKINEQDFTFLIDAFKEIQCVDAVKLLRDHKKRMQIRWLNQPSLTSEIPSLNYQVIQDQEEDKNASQSLITTKINNCGHHNNIYDRINTNINPLTINVDNKNFVSSPSEQNQPFYISVKMNKYFFFMILLLLMISGILITIAVIKRNNKTNELERKMKDETSIAHQKKQNKMSKLLVNVTSQKDEQIVQLKNQIRELQKEKNNSLIKAGEKFGHSDGIDFDDSSSSDFTRSHYLYGLVTHADKDGLESYQFLYHSSHDNQQQIQSQFHGNESFVQQYEFEFDKDEKIKRVEGQFVNKTIFYANGTNLTEVFITGLQFSSTQDHHTPSYNGPSGKTFTESFDGYILGYVTGRSNEYIEQLQFFWYRT